jgi:hypothetical protein
MREGCPKFQQRDGEVHEMAKIGTRQHDAVDSKLDDPSLPDYRAAAVVECIQFAEERLKAYPGGKMLREEYLPVDDEQILNPAWVEWNRDPEKKKKDMPRKLFLGTTAGYMDIGIISADETEAELIDWKFGNNAVEPADNNVQGIAYALGLLKKFPNLNRIKVRFIMPHLDYTTEHTFTRSDFGALMVRVRTIVRRSIEAGKDPNDFSMATPNTSSCLFCGLIGRCPKVAEIALKLGKKYRPLEIPANVTPSTVSDPKDVAIGIKLAAIVATWAEAFRRQATARTVEDPNFIPDGYVLVESQRRVVVEARKLGDIAKTFIPPEHQHLVDALYDVPIGELEKLVSTWAARGQKEKTVEDFGKKAITDGALELGKPFAFLRQNRVQEGDKRTASN